MVETNSSTTPLLASEQDPPTSLSLPSEASEFERLISTIAVHPRNRFDRPPFGAATSATAPAAVPCSPYWITIVTGTCSLLHLGFVWASFVSEKWADSVLRVEVPFLPVQRISLLDTSLASLLQQFDSSRQYIAAAFLWSTSLLIPCLFMVISPAWIIGYFNQFSKSVASQARQCLEMSMRWAFTAVFLLICITTACQYIALQQTSTALDLCTAASAGLASYCVGISAACLCVTVLRYHEQPLLECPPQRDDSGMLDPSVNSQPELPNLSSNNDDEEAPTMRILEEAPAPATIRETITEAASVIRGDVSAGAPSFFQVLLAFQAGLISILLWVPALLMPAARFEFAGFAAVFISETVHVVRLYEIPRLLYTDSISAEGPLWVLWVIWACMMVLIVACPVAATVFGVAAWMRDPGSPSRAECRRWLYAIHPAVGGIVFASTLVATVHALGSGSAYVINSISGKMCDLFEAEVGADCFSMTGQLMSGAWFYLAESLFLEIFIILTLRWS